MADFGIYRGFSDKLFEGKVPVNVGKEGSVTIPSGLFDGLLDTYTGAAAAYSLRQLSSTYTGDAIEVRRASDNSTQDIGFVNNELDTTSLESFCSGTDGFVTKWYDQSDNGNDATQGTDANQPQIVSSGSVITENGKPAAQFDGSDDYMSLSSISLTDRFSEYIVNTHTSVSNNHSIGISRWVSGTNNRQFTWRIQSDTAYDFFISQNGSNTYSLADYSSATVNTQYLYAGELNLSESQEFEHYRNNVLISSSFSSGFSNLFNSTLDMELGSFNGGGSNFQGYMQEVVFYNSDQSSNRTGIETNINDFYNIY